MGMNAAKEILWTLLEEINNSSCWRGTFRTMFEEDIKIEVRKGEAITTKEDLVTMVRLLKEECGIILHSRQLYRLFLTWEVNCLENNLTTILKEGETKKSLVVIRESLAMELVRIANN